MFKKLMIGLVVMLIQIPAYAFEPAGPPQQYSYLQAKAMGLMLTIPPEFVQAIVTTGKTPKTASEHYIFSCLAPSVQFHDKRESLPDKEYSETFGDAVLVLAQIYLEEERCLRNGAAKGKINLNPIRKTQQ